VVCTQKRYPLGLRISVPTVLKILREAGLYGGKRKVVEKKRDLRAIKRRLRAFEQIQMHKHIQRFGLSLAGSVIQTDNGTECTAPWNSDKVTMFTQILDNLLVQYKAELAQLVV